MANQSLKLALDSILKKIFKSKGDVFAEVATNWKKIIGYEYAAQISPLNIKYYKTKNEKICELVLKLSIKANSLELQFNQLVIIERVNNYLGYNAISKISFKN